MFHHNQKQVIIMMLVANVALIICALIMAAFLGEFLVCVFRLECNRESTRSILGLLID